MVTLRSAPFFSHKVTFLGYIVTSHGIKEDESMIKAFQTWLIPQSILDVRCLHGLVSFYRLFISNFRTIMALMTEFNKGTSLK